MEAKSEGIEFLPTHNLNNESSQNLSSDSTQNDRNSDMVLQPHVSPTDKQGNTNFEYISSILIDAWNTTKPWLTEFFDSAEFNIPDIPQLTRRVSGNIDYFKSNYIILGAFCLVLTASRNAFCFLLATILFYLIDLRMSIVRGTHPEKKFIYFFLAGLVLVLTNTLFDIMMSAVYTSALTFVHSAFHKTERDLPSPATTNIS